MSEPPRALTVEQSRQLFLDAIDSCILVWQRVQLEPGQDRLLGLAHSILCLFDGVSGALPCAVDLVLRPHPDDKQFYIDNGEPWIEDGLCINTDVQLHELLRTRWP